MKVKDLMLNLQKRDPNSNVYVETPTDLLDIHEVTNGKYKGKEFIVIIPQK